MNAPDRKRISQLPVATAIHAQDMMLVVQDGVTKQVAAQYMQGMNDRQQVIIGEPQTEPTYPALVFVPQMIDGQAVYEMAVSAP